MNTSSGNAAVVNFNNMVGRVMSEHATTVGSIAISWNSLMDSLGNIFYRLSGIQDVAVCYAIWNTPRNDRVLRDILLAVARIKLEHDSDKFRKLQWLIIKQFDRYSNHRDVSVHSPYSVAITNGSLSVVPNVLGGNRLAGQLKDADLIKLLRAYEKNIRTLYEFSKGIELGLMMNGGKKVWPKIPVLDDVQEHRKTKKSEVKPDIYLR